MLSAIAWGQGDINRERRKEEEKSFIIYFILQNNPQSNVEF